MIANRVANAMCSQRILTRDDVLSPEAYEEIRKERRAEVLEIKRRRRVPVGPFATFYFENYDTMWYQVHEMLRIERGGVPQIDEEIDAYAPLVPTGRELVATLMFEIADEQIRDRSLRRLGGVEDTIFVSVRGVRSVAVPEDNVERTNAGGKTSSVHFLKFPLSDDQASQFKTESCEVMLGIGHPNYAHMAVLTDQTRSELAGDLG